MSRIVPLILFLFAVPLCAAQLLAQNLGGVQLIPSKKPNFSIPFEIRDDHATDPAQSIELLVSTNAGKSWTVQSRLPLDAKAFPFQAAADGEYWFAFRTISVAGITRSSGRGGAQLRVLVDTTPPELTVTLEQQPGGEMLVVWKITDKNFPQRKPAFQVSDLTVVGGANGEKTWQPLSVESKITRREGDTLEGRFLFWPYFPNRNSEEAAQIGPDKIEIRMTATDVVGNAAETIFTAKITPVAARPASLTARMLAQQPSQKAGQAHSVGPISPPKPMRVARTVRNSHSAVTVEPQWQQAPQLPQTVATQSALPNSAISELSPQTPTSDLGLELLTRMDKLFDGRFTEDRETLLANQAAEQTAQTVREKEVQLPDFPVDSSTDFPDSPLPTVANSLPAIASEAVVSETIASRDKGEKPAVKPGKILGISLNTASDPPQMIVKWAVGEPVDGRGDKEGQIDVQRAVSPDGPWQPIVRSLPNSGEYWWYLSEADQEPFFLRVDFVKESGERFSDVTRKAIVVDGAF